VISDAYICTLESRLSSQTSASQRMLSEESLMAELSNSIQSSNLPGPSEYVSDHPIPVSVTITPSQRTNQKQSQHQLAIV